MVPAVVLFALLGRLILSLSYFGVCYIVVCDPIATADTTFLELPTNQTVVEGGDATLSCNATVNGARQPLSYRIRNGAGSTLQSVGGNNTDLSLVDGVVGACVFGEYNTQLILKGVTREANGYTVTCTVQDGLFFVAPQDEPPAFLSVICKSFDLHFMLYHSEGERHYFHHRPSCIQPPLKPAHHCVGRRRLHLPLWI